VTALQPTPPRSFARRLLGFIGLPLLSAVSPFLVLPLLARLGGVDAWAAIGVGQSVGALATVLVVAGWTLHGPARVAAATTPERLALYGDSLIGRAAVFLLMVPVVSAVAGLLAPDRAWLVASLTAVSFAFSGLSPSWYCIGVGRPGLIAAYDVVPRLVGVVLSVVLLVMTGNVLVYPLTVLGAGLAGLLLFSVRVGRVHERGQWQVRSVLGGLWRDRAAVFAVGIAGVYSTTPILLMSFVLPVGALARFSSADRFFRMGLLAIISLGNAVQGWVAEDQPSTVSRRMRRALAAHLSLGVVGGLGLALVVPPLSDVLFGRAISIEPWTAIWYGVAYCAISVNTSTGSQILVPLGGTSTVLRSTVCGAVAGVAGMLAFGWLFGGAGGAAGLALGEVMVCLVQIVGVRRLLQRSASSPGRAPAVVAEP
jgi:O-antigen/teichoic acid export membrane protein